VQGVVEEYDPATGQGVVISEPDRTPVYLRPGSLQDSIFRTLRRGQRIVFQVAEEDGRPYAEAVRVGSDGY
jgi:cold shock CspA family protein